MTSRNYGAVRDAETVVRFTKKLISEGKPFAFDIEAGYRGEDKKDVALMQFHPDYFVVGISFTNSAEWARYVPFAHDNGGNVDDIVTVARALWRLLNTGRGIAHNVAYELKGMARWFRETLWNDPEVGAEVRASRGFYPFLSDTMALVYLAACYHPLRIGKDLKSVALEAFGMGMTKFEDLFTRVDSDLGPATHAKKGYQRFNTRNSYSPKIIEYACEDSVAALLIYEKFIDDLRETKVYRIEKALTQVLIDMESGLLDDQGVFSGNMYFDWSLVQRKDDEAKEFTALMGEEIQEELGRRLGKTLNINLNSTKQLAEVLFTAKPEGLGIPINERFRSEKTGAPSTSDEALQAIAKSDPVIKKILEYRQVIKLRGSYLVKFLTEVRYSGTGYVFPNHNQYGALTGRLSVDQVSYQQWPKPYHFELSSGRTFDLNFRDLFTAPDDFRIVGFDYANVEMRVAGAMSGEPKIINAFNNGMDLHKSTAAATFKVAFEDVTKKQRQAAKAQPLYEKILTPAGWRTMGEMQVGDQVIGSSGLPIQVTGVFPQEGARKVYRVTLSDGATVDMDAGHWLWVRNRNTKQAPWMLRTLQEIMDAGWRQTTKGGKYPQPKYELPARPVVQYSETPALPIDPYFLGLLLGDGGFRGDWCPYYATSDEELAQYVRTHCPEGVRVHEDPRTDIHGFHFPSLVKHQPNSLTQALRDLGLWGKIDSDKFIPEMYLRARPADRLALLQGLMDTDGSVLYSGGNLRVTSQALVEGAQEIARSLGGTATFGTVPAQHKPVYRTQIMLPSGMNPFRLVRKASKVKTRTYLAPVRIFDVKPVGVEDVQCISVDASDGLYISNGYSVIHNTLNFATLYGSGAGNISEMLTTPEAPVTKEDAAKMLADYYAGYPVLSDWIDHLRAVGRQQKFVTTHFGRKFTLWDLYEREEWKRDKADRLAVNAPVQGTAADIMKLAMGRVQHEIKKAGLAHLIRLTLTIHDALEFLVHKSISTQQVIDLVEPSVNFHVPGFPLEIRADWHEGYQWGAMADIKLDKDKQVCGYGMEYELPWSRESFEWDGDTLHEVLDQYYTWEWQRFGVSATYYARRNPEFVLPPKEVPEKAQDAAVDPDDEDPGWFHSEAWHEAHNNPQTATVTLVDMPTNASWKTFLDYLTAHPGFNKVVVETPEGSITLDTLHRLTPEDQPQISLILGGAGLVIASDFVDADAVMEGVVL